MQVQCKVDNLDNDFAVKIRSCAMENSAPFGTSYTQWEAVVTEKIEKKRVAFLIVYMFGR